MPWDKEHCNTLVYQQAGDWLRMVNTITWSLTSIFLVGAILALNSAVQKNDIEWTHAVGWNVFYLSCIWGFVDFINECSAIGARRRLTTIENTFPVGVEKFYTKQAEGCWNCLARWSILIPIATPIIGVAIIALGFATKEPPASPRPIVPIWMNAD